MSMTFEAAAAAHHAGDFAAAERGYLGFPGSRNAHYNLGRLYRETGRLSEAEAQFRLILRHAPDFHLAGRALGMTLLAQGRYAEAWPFYEARHAVQQTPQPLADYPPWRGEPLNGRRLTLVAEQGFGDQMMFARYVPLLRAAGAQVTLACDPRHLARFFEHAGFATAAYAPPALRQLPPGDYWVHIASVPLWLAAAAPPPPVYAPTPDRGKGVGVLCQGNPVQTNDQRRSMRGADAEAFLSLGRPLAPAATGARDFHDTAEIVAELELVITTDTALAHLAGAMGRRCWVLLPRVGMDWRWNDGVRSDWYPDMRLFRQPSDGDWASVIAQVRAELDAERSA